MRRYGWLVLGLGLATTPLQAAPQPAKPPPPPAFTNSLSFTNFDIDHTAAPVSATALSTSTNAAPVAPSTNAIPVVPIAASTNEAPVAPSTNAAPVMPVVASTNAAPVEPSTNAAPVAPTPPTLTLSTPVTSPAENTTLNFTPKTADPSSQLILTALLAFGSLGGFLLYQSGLTRAKNCGYTATLLLIGVVFAWIGYWMGGFAVQTGGVGDAHAALTGTISQSARGALDHELGFLAGTHHWGIMGSAGFFLATDPGSANSIAALFLSQAALLTIAVAAALGAALERSRITAMAIGAFLIGALIYPLLANWVWGGGWLAELGRETGPDGLGHGFVDWAGAGVVHETAAALALVFALVIGPRYGRFGPNKTPKVIPGHNMPFVILGALLLLISWTAANAFAGGESLPVSGVAAVNTLLAAAAGLMISFLLAGWKKKRAEPALLCRGLLGGAVASCASGGLIDPWAAFVIGGFAGLFVQGVVRLLEKRRIDDPTGAVAVHGMAGLWGVLALGIFANGTAGEGINAVPDPVRGLFYGGGLHQFGAQMIGCVTIFVVVFILGLACLTIVKKIVGVRIDLADETGGLDLPQTGVLGYQGDIDDLSGKE